MTDAQNEQVVTKDQAKEMVEEAVADFVKKMTGSSITPAPTPHVSRWEERDRQRKANAQIAREAAAARVRRKVSLVERVERAKTRLAGVNVAGAVALIQETSPAEYDHYILAEKYGQNRSGVLRNFGPPRASVETAYLAEAGLGSPDLTPDEGV
jgi:hypothetical protein